jgi:S1-C subfamily serine protease
MKKIVSILAVGILIMALGGLGSFLFNYVFLAKIATDPLWSEHPIVTSMNERMQIIKTTEKIIVEENESIADIASRAATTVVYIESTDADGVVTAGNGVVVGSDGVIVTSTNVITDQTYRDAFVKLYDDSVHEITNVFVDTHSGIVFAQIDAQNLATIPFANSDDAQSGKQLISIMRTRMDSGAHFASGGLMGHLYDFSIATPRSDHLQGVLDLDFTVSILRENVGAPVVDYQGNMVGLISYTQGDAADIVTDPVFYAIAANDVYRSFEDYLRTKQQADTYAKMHIQLGVDYETISSIDVRARDLEVNNGVVITAPQTYADRLAFNKTLGARSGLRGGDIVVMVNNDMIDARNGFSTLLRQYAPGDDVVLGVVRDGTAISVTILPE